MGSEQAEALSPDLRSWVEKRAEETGTTPESVLVRALTAYRFLEGEGESIEEVAPPGSGAFAEVVDRLDDVERRLAETERSVESDVEDLRDRVVQVKREADDRAPADHDHPDLDDRVDRAEDRAEAAASRVDDLAADLADLESRVGGGFENYEEVLTYLTDTTEELEERTRRLAGAVVDARRTLVRLESATATRAAADDLRREANRHGETRARCGDCDGTVDLTLLSAPECPHCGATLAGFEPGSGFFSSATLTVGDRPALDGETESVDDPADLLEGRDE
jgi:phage shock protein A